jgi:hypothetical protein
MTSYPALGPLIAVAFDKAVGIMVSRWKLLLFVLLTATGAGFFSFTAVAIPNEVFFIYWACAAYANAVRIVHPAYAMRLRTAAIMLAVNVAVDLLIALGLVALVIPGVRTANRLSMSVVVAAIEEKNVRAALRRSWIVTGDPVEGRTLAFNVVLWIAEIGAVVAGYFLLSAIAVELGRITGAGLPLTGVKGAALGFAFAAFVITLSYGIQAKVIAQVSWYRWLVTRIGAPVDVS